MERIETFKVKWKPNKKWGKKATAEIWNKLINHKKKQDNKGRNHTVEENGLRLKNEIYVIRKTIEKLDMKNHGKRAETTEGSITNRIKEM